MKKNLTTTSSNQGSMVSQNADLVENENAPNLDDELYSLNKILKI